MNIMHNHRLTGIASLVAGVCLVQGCATMYSDEEGEEMRLRPMPTALEPAPVQVTPAAPSKYSVPTPGATLAPSTAAAQRDALATDYTVKSGDTLSGIAYRYRLRWQDIAAVNPQINPNRLLVGEVIQLPGKVDVAHPVRAVTTSTVRKPASAKGGNYVVKSGDSLSVIAHRHGTSLAEIKKVNGLTGDKIVVGQKLVIPGLKASGTESAPAKPTAPVAPVQPAPPTLPDDIIPPLPAPEAPVLEPVDAPPAPAPTPAPEMIAPPPLPTLPGTAPAPAAGAGLQNHTVAPGEDIYAVAVRWGVSTAAIKEANNLTGADLVPGSVLKIPPLPATP